jgi:hypothetical protein
MEKAKNPLKSRRLKTNLGMRKFVHFTLVLFAIMSTSLHAQKSCKLIPVSDEARSLASVCHIKLDTMTKLVGLYNWNALINVNVAKSGDYYYLVFYFAHDKKAKIEFSDKNSLDLYLADSTKLHLFPCSNAKNKEERSNMNITYYQGSKTYDNNKVTTGNVDISSNLKSSLGLYQLTKDQLSKLAETDLEYLNLYFTSQDKVKGKEVDQAGDSYLKYEIRSAAKRALKPFVQCILQDR